MDRRELLSRHSARAAGQFLGLLADGPAVEETDPRALPPLVRVGRDAMGTHFEVMIPFGIPDVVEAATAALDEIDRLEDQLTVYRDHGEVSSLNRLAAVEPVPVSDNLFALMQLAARVHRETEGAFDVAVGSLIKTWGFFKGPRRVPSHTDRLTALRDGGLRNVVLDPETKTVRFRNPGVEINLGSIGKGFALDEAARRPRTEWNVTSALLHGGHSSVLAVGGQPGKARGWEVGLTHPWEPGRRLGLVHLRDGALATSAATFRHLEYNGKKLGHILDPRTGWPAEGVTSCSVLAPTAAEADALATAFFVLGVEKARSYCAAHPDVGVVILPEGETTPILLGLALSQVDLVSPLSPCGRGEKERPLIPARHP